MNIKKVTRVMIFFIVLKINHNKKNYIINFIENLNKIPIFL
jgi:hypothetical protein